MNDTKINSTLLKDINRKIVLKVVDEAKNISRVEIRKNLNKDGKTITNIVNSLLDDGLLIQNGYSSFTGGRRGELLKINPEYGYIIGIYLGIDFIKGVMVDFSKNIIERKNISVSPTETKDALLLNIKKTIDFLIKKSNISISDILGIGFIANGFYDNSTGKWILSVNNLNWKDVHIKEYIQKDYDIPIYLEDSTNMMAINEGIVGKAKNKKDYIFLDIGMGVGCGIIYDNNFLRGSTNIAGEFGHTTVVLNGKICSCGKKGCLETVSSGWAMIKEAKEEIQNGTKSKISDLCEGDLNKLNIDMIFQAFFEGDKLAQVILENSSEYLSLSIANLINLFNPELVVFGGYIVTLGDYYLKMLENKIKKYTMKQAFDVVKIVNSTLDHDATVLGATSLVRDPFFRIAQLTPFK